MIPAEKVIYDSTYFLISTNPSSFIYIYPALLHQVRFVVLNYLEFVYFCSVLQMRSEWYLPSV